MKKFFITLATIFALGIPAAAQVVNQNGRPAAPARAIWSSFRRLALTSRVGGRWSDGGHGQTAGRFGHGGTR